MMKIKRLFSLVAIIISALLLASCSKTAENEHLPEYCRTYSGFMEFASPDIYELLGGINSAEYLSTISTNELIFIVYEENREIDLDGIQCFQNLTSLTLEGPAFKDISPISALKNIQQITLESTNVVNISSFRNLSKVNNLTIANTKTLQSVEGVEEMTKLTYLNLSDNGIVNVDELNQLVNLDTLILSNNEISFFPSINQLEKLETLNVSNNKINRLGDDLSGLRNLVNLNMSENELCDISTLDDLVNLETLDLSFNDLGCNVDGPDFSSLEGATKLKSLKLNDNDLTSIQDLTGRNLPLEILQLENNLLDDISPISGFTQLKSLTIFNNNISDISELSNMDNITQIDLSENSITDFSNLRSIDDLELIDLSDNEITFIPDISSSWPSLKTLNLENNVVTDMSGVKGHQNLQTLIINNNNMSSIKGLSDLPSLTEFRLYQEEVEIEDPENPQLPEDKPNIITLIEDSFNSVPLLTIEEEGELLLDYQFGANMEILGSFTNDDRVEIVDLSGMDIDVIDASSFELENLEAIYVQNNNIADMSFILGNPELRQIDISGNPITNLTILTGLNETLGNLEQIRARDITGSNDLETAFVSLPDLNFVDLTNTNIASIKDSFNDLDELTTLVLVGDNLTTIENSFNRIFASYSAENIINLKDGNLYSITDSFNFGSYEQLVIRDHSTTELITVISGSFNDLTVASTDSIVISGNDFDTIDNSFNRVLADNIGLLNNGTSVMTNVFDQTDIEAKLNLQNNNLETVDLSGLLSLNELDISNNSLTTVGFIDSIPDLTILDISTQLTPDGLSLSLTEIDGINGMSGLTDLTMNDLSFTSINGFKNIGITSIDLSYATNNDIFITSINSESFEGSLITSLDLGEHQLTDIAFLSNFTVLTSLDIGLDMADLSGLTGQTFEATLTNFELQSQQLINDYSIFSGYDSVTDFTVDDSNMAIINNLDGLSGLVNLTLVQVDQVTDINNSFNTLPSLDFDNTYLDDYTLLSNIDSSFDIFGLNGLHTTVNIDGSITTVDSFNNVVNVSISNGLELAPLFDDLSFDAVQSMVFDQPNYDSYSFISDYSTLTSLSIVTLGKNITDLTHDSLMNVTMPNISSGVNSLTLDINANATLDIGSTMLGLLTVNSDNDIFEMDFSNGDITLNTTATDITLGGLVDDLIVNNNTVTDVSFTSLSTSNITLNTNALDTITSNAVSGSNASVLEINTLVPILNVDANVTDLDVYDNTLHTITIDSPLASVDLYTVQPDMTVNGTLDTLDMVYNTLETVTFAAQIETATINSTVLDTINAGADEIDTFYITSSEQVFTLSGTDLNNVNISNNSINDITVNAPLSTVLLSSSNNETMNFNIIANSMLFNTGNVTSMISNNATDIDILDLENLSSLNSVVFNNASVDQVDIDTASATLTLTGVGVGNASVVGPNINDITLDLDSATLDLDTNVATLSCDTILDSFEIINGTSLDSIIFTDTTVLNSFALTNTNGVSSIDFGLGTLPSLSMSTTDASFTFDGTNVGNLTLTGNSISTLDVEIPTSTFTFNSTKSGSTTIHVLADQVDLNMNSSTIALDSTSIVDTLVLDDSSLSTLLLGNADIELIDMNDSSTFLDITGTQVANLDIDDTISSLTLSVSLSSVVDFNTTTASPITIDTNTSDITVVADSPVTLTSSTLESATVNNPNERTTFDVTKPSLDFTVGGSMGTARFNTSNVSTVTFDVSTTTTTLEFVNTGVSIFDFTNTTVTDLDITTSETALSIDSSTLNNSIINGVNLTSLAVSNNTSGVYDVFTNASSFDFDGTVDQLDLSADNVTSLDMLNSSINTVVLDIDSLLSLDLIDVTTDVDDLAINNNTNNFVLDTNASTLQLNSVSTNKLVLNSTLVGTMDVTTNVDEIEFNASDTSYTVSGSSLNTISGTLNNLTLNGLLGSGALTISANTDDILINNEVINSVFLTGTTVTGLTVNSDSVSNIATNSVDFNTLSVNTGIASLAIDSLADNITVNGLPESSLTFNVRENGQTLTVNSANITLNTTNASSTSVVYDNPIALDLTVNNLNVVTVSVSGATSAVIDADATEISLTGATLDTVSIEGNITDVTLIGTLIATVTTTDLFVDGIYTMNDTAITSLDFVSANMMTVVDTISVNTLDVANIGDVIALLDGTGKTLDTNLTLVNVYDYFYDEKYTELSDLETTTGARFDAYYNPLRDAALATFRSNTYFDYITVDQDLYDEIDAQVYQTAEQYLLGYALDQGYTDVQDMEDNTSVSEVNDIRVSIQATLDDASLVIDSAQINVDVEADIVSDSDTYATTERDTIGFTIT